MQRVLLVKLGAIGDALMLLPAAHALHMQGYAVHWLCGRQIARLLRLYPWIVPIEVEERDLFSCGVGSRMRALLRLWPQLTRTRYDFVATLYYDPRYRLLTLPVRARRHIALEATGRETRLLPGRHHTDEYARILLGLADDVRPVAMAPVPPPLMPPSPLGPEGSRPRVVLLPGGAKNLLRDDALRRWPVESYAEVAQALLPACEVLVAGGPEDGWVLPAFAGLAIRGCVGQYSLVDTLGLLASSSVVVTHDTGPLHLAGLTEAGIVSVFGPTDPHTRLPQRAGALAIWGGEGFACRSCYDGQEYANCHCNECVRQVTPAMVVGQVRLLLEQRRTGSTRLAVVREPSALAEGEARRGEEKS